jgi:di/tripeptidase
VSAPGKNQTPSLNLAVKRNAARFPEDFMFRLTKEEIGLRFQFEASKTRGGRRYLPYAFTEQGVAMLSSVLNSSRAVQVNIAIMRTFVRLRQILATHKDIAEKLQAMERKYDKRFKVVFEILRRLTAPPPEGPKRPIGFVSGGPK